MSARHPRQRLPRVWMFSDERMGDAFLPALMRLPKGAGLVFRHYGLTPQARRTLFEDAVRIARARRVTVLLAGSPRLARAWRADGVHGGLADRSRGLRNAPVHNRRELIAARRAGVDAVFISPVFATRSHPDAPVLGRRGFAMLARQARAMGLGAYALGGMDARRARTLTFSDGWAGIDAWILARID